MSSYFILFLLGLTIVSVSSRNVDLMDDHSEEVRSIDYSSLYQPIRLQDLVMKYLVPTAESKELRRLARKAKVIIKGDPREFMG